MTMLEKMALAIYNEAEKQCGYVGKFQAHNNETRLDGDFDLVGFSRAALQALLEPSEGMKLVGSDGPDHSPYRDDIVDEDFAEDIFQRMIQAALDGK